MVRCPLIASTAIFPFRSALYCFRCLFFFMCLHGRQQFYTLAVCLNFGEYRQGQARWVSGSDVRQQIQFINKLFEVAA